jgi:DNA uptake protein ComE-like DNA-binding protein
VIITIVVGYFSERVARSVELAQQTRQNTQAAIDMVGTRAEILYRIGTTSIDIKGLGSGVHSIALDNRPYHGVGNSIVRLQDNRGLLNLNLTDDDRLRRFLGVMGVPADQHGRMIDTLRDYIDQDDFVRLNGAERDDYLAQNLPSPANNRLTTPWEVERIIGWRDILQRQGSAQFSEFTTTSLSYGINPNTAPLPVLATLPGMTEALARTLIAQRELIPFANAPQIAALTGTGVEQMMYIVITLPSSAFRITQSVPGIPWAIQYNVSLTPNDSEAPWRIDYHTKTGIIRGNVDAPKIPDLPPRTTTAPNRIPSFLAGS